jgi:signal transduction histidine kinase
LNKKWQPVGIFFLSMFLWGAFTFISYQHESEDINQKIEHNLLSVALSVESKQLRIKDLLAYGNRIISNYSAQPNLRNIISKNLDYSESKKLLLTEDFSKIGFGSLTYRGKSVSPVLMDEFERVLSLTPLFIEAKNVFPKSPWVYFTSENYIYMYPFVTSNDFSANDHPEKLEFYNGSLPKNNPKKMFFWTKPYDDLGGKGLMVTASLPVYVEKRFLGALSIDVVLKELTNQISLFELKEGELLFLDKSGSLLASNKREVTVKNIDEKVYSEKFLASISTNDSLSIINDKENFLYIYKIPKLDFYFIYKINGLSLLAYKAMHMTDSFYLLLMLLLLNGAYWYYFKAQNNIQQMTESRNKFALLSEISIGMAHQINNPLTVIKGKSELLKGYAVAEKNTYLIESLDKILSSTNRVAEIIQTFKTFSRLNSSESMALMPLVKLIDNALVLCGSTVKSHGIELLISEIPEVRINCRAYQIEQVLINLINNSCAEIKDNQQTKWIKLTFEIKDQYLLIRVIDSGRGVSKENREKIFEPFFTANVSAVDGVGLGLSISKKIALDHNGELYYEGEAHCTTFVLKLKLGQKYLSR